MPRLSRVRAPTLLTSAILTIGCSTDVRGADQLVELLRIVPADAHAALVIPNLKRASDDLTRMLEGMDRSGILLGSRPIDQFKSNTGFITEIDDQGSAAIILFESAAQPPQWVAVLPPQDVDGFFEGNFTGRPKNGDDAAYTRADGSTMFASVVNSHVAMCTDAASLRRYQPGDGLGVSLAAQLGARPLAGLDDADALLVIRSPALDAVKQRRLGQAAAQGSLLPGAAVLAQALADDIDTLVFAVQFDPLALIVHATAILKDGSTFGMRVPAKAIADAGLARLPAQSAALAISIDLAAMGGDAMLQSMAEAMHEPMNSMPPWLKQVRSLQFMVAPSEAGANAGALNAAVLILAGDDPAALRDALKNEVIAAGEGSSPTAATKWNDAQQLADGSAADAYEIRAIDPSAEEVAVEALLFGPSGPRGYVRQLADCLVLTFAQRQPLLTQASNAAASAGADGPSGFGSSPAVKVMRGWMPAQRDIEAYIGAAQVLAMLEPYQAMLPLHGFGLPEIDANAPPIGLAMDVTARRADAALIVPSGVLAPVFDEVMRYIRARPVIHDATAEPLGD